MPEYYIFQARQSIRRYPLPLLQRYDPEWGPVPSRSFPPRPHGELPLPIPSERPLTGSDNKRSAAWSHRPADSRSEPGNCLPPAQIQWFPAPGRIMSGRYPPAALQWYSFWNTGAFPCIPGSVLPFLWLHRERSDKSVLCCNTPVPRQ